MLRPTIRTIIRCIMNKTTTSTTTTTMEEDGNYKSHSKPFIQSFFVQANLKSNQRFVFGLVIVFATSYCLGYLSAIALTTRESNYNNNNNNCIDSSFGGNGPMRKRKYRHHESYLSEEECKSKLDSLERIYNQRRSVRQQIVANAKAANMNVYEYLWKIAIPSGANSETLEKYENYEKRSREIMKFDMWEPEANCILEERFGGGKDSPQQRYNAFGDGPKFVCGIDYIRDIYSPRNENNNKVLRSLQRPCLVYSIGSNNDIQFEKAVHNFLGDTCETYTFDPTLLSSNQNDVDDPRRSFVGDTYATFLPWGLGVDGKRMSYGQHNFTLMSLEHMMNELGHTGRKIDLFKIDCEHCEYTAMKPIFDLISEGKLEIDQILIEMHRTSYEHITEFFENADNAKLRIVHKERNGWGCLGIRCVEYVLVSESYLRSVTASVVC